MRLIFEDIRLPYSWCAKSSICGGVYLSGIVLAFKAR